MQNKVVLARHAVVAEGSHIRDGGTVRITFHADERMGINDIPFASVGDEAVYSDERVSYIDSGAGFAAAWRGCLLALVGSTTTPVPDGLIIDEIKGEPIPGLFERGYRLPSAGKE